MFNSGKFLHVAGGATTSQQKSAIMKRMLGFSLLEMLIVVMIIVSLATIGIPQFVRYKIQAQSAKAVTDLQTLNTSIQLYVIQHGGLPSTLTQVVNGNIADPWGNPYQYLKIEGNPNANSEARKDLFLIVVNSDFDLYSMGPDGQTIIPLAASVSQDDAIRANDGGYFGIASNY
jgi:general secretion pathway protein G